MKRWAFRISPRRAAFGGTICLILGAVMTYLVAWGLLYYRADLHRLLGNGQTLDTDRSRLDDPRLTRLGVGTVKRTPGTVTAALVPHEWGTSVPQDLPVTEVGAWSRLHDPEQLEETINHHRAARGGTAYGYYEQASGWPMYAVSSSFLASYGSTDIIVLGALERPVDWYRRKRIPQRYPLRPIVPGFLINTLFWAVVCFGLFFGRGMTRRFFRIRRGRCPLCDHDLRGEFDHGCFECGWHPSGGRIEDAGNQH